MKREWKPGDVAHVPGVGVAVRNDHGWLSQLHPDPAYAIEHYSDARPLVVIDPEDREQAERLSSLVEANGGPSFGGRGVDALSAALREFASPTPPKPDEPTGLGAVVEDAEGERWVRRECGPVWVNSKGSCFPADWHRIAAVRVLSEGVQA